MWVFTCISVFAQNGSGGFVIGGGNNTTSGMIVTYNGIRYYIMPKSGNHDAQILPSSVADGYKGDITIPEDFRYNGNTYYVRKISDSCFVNNKKITSLVLPYSLINWGNYYEPDLVKGCDNLKHYYINGVYNTYIEDSNVLYKYYYRSSLVTDKYLSLLYYPSGLKDENFTIYSGCEHVSLDKFNENKYVKNINIPWGVKSVYNGTKGKSNVENVNISIDNSKFRSVDGIVYSKDYRTLELYPSGRKKNDFEIPSSVTSINTDAFAYCDLKKITFTKNIKSVSKFAFYESHIDTLYIEGNFADYEFLKGLKSTSTIYVHAKDYSLAKKNFKGTIETYEKFWVEEQTKTMLGKVIFTIPKYILPATPSVGPNHPRNISIGSSKSNTKNLFICSKYDYKIKQVSVNDLVIECDSIGNYMVDNLLPESKYVVQFDWEKYSRKGELLEKGTDYDTIATQTITFSKKIDKDKIKEYNDYYYTYHVYSIDSLCVFVSASTDESLSPSEIGCYVKELDKYIKANKNGLVIIDNLYPGSKFTLLPYAIYCGKRYNSSTIFAMETNVPTCNIALKSTQTTAEIKDINIKDYWGRVSNPSVVKLFINNKEYHWNGTPIVINNLKPNSTYEMAIQLVYDENHIITNNKTFKTIPFHSTIRCISSGPTSVHLKGGYDLGDAKIEDSYFDGYEKKGEDIVITGLNPEKEYSFKYAVKASGVTEYASIEITTPKLILEMQQPKVVSNNSSIVSAKTNIDNAEKSVGFEWRKIDSPDIIPSKTGNGIVYEGVLEGRIFNLNSTSYYKVRPFFKANDETMYYGSWVGFDPSDYSYFEPIVHTYNNVIVQNLTAKVKGIVLQGSNEILEQGFELWIKNAKERSSVTEKQKILCKGQNMEVELDNLKSNTTYYFHAFARTLEGFVYGQTFDFTTPTISHINEASNTASKSLKLNIKVKDGVLIRIEGAKNDCFYRLVDINGTHIASGVIKNNDEWHKIVNHTLPQSVYIIAINDGICMKTAKILFK